MDAAQYEEAALHLNQAVWMFNEQGLEEHRQVAVLDLGAVQMETGAMDAALDRAREVAETGGPETRWLALLNAGAVHYRRQQFSDAVRSFCDAATALEEVGDADKITEGMPLLLTHLADVAKDTGHYESALKLLSKAVDQATEKRQPDVYMESLLTMAKCSQALGRLSDAKRQLEQAVVLAGFLFEDHNRLGVAKSMLAEILVALGELDAAKEQARSAVRIANRVGGPRGIALASLALACIALSSGQYSDARDHADDAIVESQRARRLHEQAMARSLKARASLGLAAQGIEGMILDAESEARRAVQVADQSGAVRERALARLTLARVLSEASRGEQSEAILQEVVVLLQSGAASLEDLLGDSPKIPMLLQSATVDLRRVFADSRVEAPQIEFETKVLQGRLPGAGNALEPLRDAAAALTRLLAGLTAEDAVRYGKANPDTDVLYREFSRLAATDDDRRQLRLLADRAQLTGDMHSASLAAISGKS
jgi:tetratricopeptide (TPR) repeat protein